ncbi:hypothetical protein AVEN_172796-1 [Araneus ventricosus]|uniref:Uncharacterized protein n=1 Tax=Araneus ventricosus TaxID=182803 RepID=A0A4Y2BKJ0_ARAVE|nr:hypothetical protein AVEN_172796-1 [Araneus ventricosus]
MRLHHLQRNQRPCTPVLVRSLCPSFLTTRAHCLSSSWNGEPPSTPSVIKPLYRTLNEPSSRNGQACCPMTLFSCMIMPPTHGQCGEDDIAAVSVGNAGTSTVQSRPFTV